MSAHPHEPERDDPAAAEAADQPEQPEEPQQPAEADVADEPGKVIELRRERGSLTLRPGQRDLDAHQIAALVAIGIDPKADPGVGPHIRPFMHMCQVRGLDPWAREAYLIGRGKDDNRKYTMQVAIDGYRKMAGATGKFIRVKKVLWTGSDDDDRSYVQARDEDGDIVMQRVWFDQWPESRGNPGAAKVVIEHYDDYGNVTTTPAIADWSMYAPYKDVWAYDPAQRKRAPVKDANGKTVQELNEMWAKGGPHMLAKCAEALAHRKAFPGAMAGVYVHEEMHRLDQAERNRQASEQREARQRAFAEHQQRKALDAHAAAQTVTGEVSEQAEPESGPLPPVHVSEAVAQTLDEMSAQPQPERAQAAEPERAGERAPQPEPPTDEQRVQWLRDELRALADLLGRSVNTLCQRQQRIVKRNPAQFTADDLWAVVKPLRQHGLTALSRKGRDAEATAYAAAMASDQVAPLGALFGHDRPAPAENVDPRAPHAFVDDEGVCAVPGCEKFADDSIHEVG